MSACDISSGVRLANREKAASLSASDQRASPSRAVAAPAILNGPCGIMRHRRRRRGQGRSALWQAALVHPAHLEPLQLGLDGGLRQIRKDLEVVPIPRDCQGVSADGEGRPLGSTTCSTPPPVRARGNTSPPSLRWAGADVLRSDDRGPDPIGLSQGPVQAHGLVPALCSLKTSRRRGSEWAANVPSRLPADRCA
jgi:hypothetical protein